MKPSPCIIAAVSVLLFLWCSTLDPDGANPPEQQFSIAKSETVVRENPSASSEDVMKQAESINNFAVAMYQQLKDEGKNLFFSPYSITAALAMTAAGANGNTKQQILDALQVTLQGVAFDQAINAIDQSIMSHADATAGLTLKVVNSAWLQSGWNFKVSYLDHLAKYYGAGVNLLDFSSNPDECRTVINTWVAGQTNDKILNLLPEGSIVSNTALVLTNAIYFLADWLYAFNPDCTMDKDFRLMDNSTVKVPGMSYNNSDSAVVMRYSRMSGVSALDFPYKGDRLAMTVLLPDSGAFTSAENSLSASMLSQLFSAFRPETLQVSLPKFTFTFGTVSLTDAFKALGMTDAFQPELADFSGIDGTRDLCVDDIYHKAFINVDEKGTEAAAATAVVLIYKSARPVFIVNRPFIFVIRDKETGTVLFIGRVLNPLESE
jgi:serpin B